MPTKSSKTKPTKNNSANSDHTASKLRKTGAPPQIPTIPASQTQIENPPNIPITSPTPFLLTQKPEKPLLLTQEPEKTTTASLMKTKEHKPAPKNKHSMEDFLRKQQEFNKKRKVVTSPTQDKSTSHKVYTAILVTGEVIAWVADRYKADKPAYIKPGISSLYNDNELKKKSGVTCIMKRRSLANPDNEWGMTITPRNRTTYQLHWSFLVRLPVDGVKMDLVARQAWGNLLAKFFQMAEKKEHTETEKYNTSPSPQPGTPPPTPNEFKYGGDSNPTGDQVLMAGNVFCRKDIMYYLIIPQFQMQPAQICTEEVWILEGYYGSLAEATKFLFIQPTTPLCNPAEEETADDLMSVFD